MGTKDIAKTEGSSPAEMIKLAVSGGADLEKFEKLLTLQERWEANEARKAYHRAMSEFKANPPKIEKDRTVAYGNTKYNHATLANVTEKINAELSKHGLSASWDVKQNGAVSVTCRITHVQGHSEETTISAPADNSGSKNQIQAIGSAITYLQRYSLLALTGLAAADQDDDGCATGEPVESIDAKQMSQIMDYLAELNVPEAKFCAFLKVANIESIPKCKFQQAITVLENRRKKIAADGSKK